MSELACWVKVADELVEQLKYDWSEPVQVRIAYQESLPPNDGQNVRLELVFRTAQPDWSTLQDDLAELLRTLDLGDHARPYSPHEVLQAEVLPRIRELLAAQR